MLKTGLDQFDEKVAPLLQGKKVALLAHPASVNSQLVHASTLLKKNQGWQLTTMFGPQHGWLGNDQDNMIEWEGEHMGKLQLYSLYGQYRKPTPEMLQDCEVIVVDLQDVGCRVYTFIQTLYLVMQAAGELGKQVVVLDRPNPIGHRVMGPLLDPDYATFVGFTEICLRHGLTIGEMTRYYRTLLECDTEIILMQNYQAGGYFAHLPWVAPSPNMPTLDTAIVYPGTVLFEATHISEARGTTRPFEYIGAPDINSDSLAAELNDLKLPGVCFRAIWYTPTFHKFKDQLCGGVQIHVTDHDLFEPILTATALIKSSKASKHFQWLAPPYEYEYEKMPIDILAGSDRFRLMIEDNASLQEFADWFTADAKKFEEQLNEKQIRIYNP